MAISLLLSAYLGIRQEEIYRTYGAENSQRLMLYVVSFDLHQLKVQYQITISVTISLDSFSLIFERVAPLQQKMKQASLALILTINIIREFLS